MSEAAEVRPSENQFTVGIQLDQDAARAQEGEGSVDDGRTVDHMKPVESLGWQEDTQPAAKEVKQELGLDLQQEKTGQVADTKQEPKAEDAPKVQKKLTPSPPKEDTQPAAQEVKQELGLDLQQEKTGQVADTKQELTAEDVPKVQKKLTPTPPKAPPPAHLLQARSQIVLSASSQQTVGDAPPGGQTEVQQASTPSSSSAPPRKLPSWNASIAMTREAAEQLKLQAVVLDGDTTAADAMIRTAGKVGLWISRQIPFEDFSSKAIASLKFVPSGRNKALCADYAKYFFSKGQAGVVKLHGSLTLYIIPPAAIQTCGLGGLRDVPHLCLVGAITEALPDSEAAAEPSSLSSTAAVMPSDLASKDAKEIHGTVIAEGGPDRGSGDQVPAQVAKPFVRAQTQPSAGSSVKPEGNELQQQIDQLFQDQPSKVNKTPAASNNASSKDPEVKSKSKQEDEQLESTARSKAKATIPRTSAKSKKKAKQSDEKHGARRETPPRPLPHIYSAPFQNQNAPAHPYQHSYPPHVAAHPYHPPHFYPSYAPPVHPVYPGPAPQPYLFASINTVASPYARPPVAHSSWPVAHLGPALAGVRPGVPQDGEQGVRERKRKRSRSRKRRKHKDHKHRHKEKKKSRREKGESDSDGNKVTEQSLDNLTARLKALVETDEPCSDSESSNSSGDKVASEEL